MFARAVDVFSGSVRASTVPLWVRGYCFAHVADLGDGNSVYNVGPLQEVLRIYANPPGFSNFFSCDPMLCQRKQLGSRVSPISSA